MSDVSHKEPNQREYSDSNQELLKKMQTRHRFSRYGDAKTQKGDVACWNCGEKGHYQRECTTTCHPQPCQLGTIEIILR